MIFILFFFVLLLFIFQEIKLTLDDIFITAAKKFVKGKKSRKRNWRGKEVEKGEGKQNGTKALEKSDNNDD